MGHARILLTPVIVALCGMIVGCATAPSVPPPKKTPMIKKILRMMGERSTWGHPDQFGEYSGMIDLFDADYAGAMKYFKQGAYYADKLSQFEIGMMYLTGRGVKRNAPTACAWFVLADQRHYPVFTAMRNKVCEALTPAQRSHATAKLATLLPVYGDKVAKPRMADVLKRARSAMTGSQLGYNQGVDVICFRYGLIQPGCGGVGNFWAPSRWDPKKYFAMRNAQWRGTVSVGPLQQAGSSHSKADKGSSNADNRQHR